MHPVPPGPYNQTSRREIVTATEQGDSRGVRTQRQTLDRGAQVPIQMYTVKAVCGSCNNGWMSRLENHARSILTAMASGVVRLTNVERKVLARWVTKTLIMWDHTNPADLCFTNDQVSAVREGTDLPNVIVRIGKRRWLTGEDGLNKLQLGLMTNSTGEGEPDTASGIARTTLGFVGFDEILFYLAASNQTGTDLHLSGDSVIDRRFIAMHRGNLLWPESLRSMTDADFTELTHESSFLVRPTGISRSTYLG